MMLHSDGLPEKKICSSKLAAHNELTTIMHRIQIYKNNIKTYNSKRCIRERRRRCNRHMDVEHIYRRFLTK